MDSCNTHCPWGDGHFSHELARVALGSASFEAVVDCRAHLFGNRVVIDRAITNRRYYRPRRGGHWRGPRLYSVRRLMGDYSVTGRDTIVLIAVALFALSLPKREGPRLSHAVLSLSVGLLISMTLWGILPHHSTAV